jgi:hypothetical protein
MDDAVGQEMIMRLPDCKDNYCYVVATKCYCSSVLAFTATQKASYHYLEREIWQLLGIVHR